MTQVKLATNLKSKSFRDKATPLNWQAAKKKLFAQNLQYLRAVRNTKETKKLRKQQWRRHLPQLFAAARVDSALEDIARLSSDDFRVSLTSNFNLPNPINYYAQAYAYALQEVQSESTLELQRRNLHARLYRAFTSYQTLAERGETLAQKQRELEVSTVGSLSSSILNLRKEQAQHRVALERQRIALNSLFNTPGANWALTGSPPTLNYANKLPELDLYKNFGQLALKIQAAEIEANTLALWNVKFSRWPTIGIDLNTPQFAVSNTDNSLNFDAENFTLFTGLSKSIKVDDIWDKKQLRNAEFRAKATRQALRSRVESEIVQLEINKRTYRELLIQKEQLNQLAHTLSNKTADNSPVGIKSQLQSLKTINNQLRNIDRQLTQLDLQFWIWDDRYWKKH